MFLFIIKNNNDDDDNVIKSNDGVCSTTKHRDYYYISMHIIISLFATLWKTLLAENKIFRQQCTTFAFIIMMRLNRQSENFIYAQNNHNKSHT